MDIDVAQISDKRKVDVMPKGTEFQPGASGDTLVDSFSEHEELTRKLERSIRTGDVTGAKEMVTRLAQSRCLVQCRLLDANQLPDEATNFRLSIQAEIEDWQGSEYGQLLVVAQFEWTVFDLKKFVKDRYSVPTDVQVWIFDKKIPLDTESLSQLYYLQHPLKSTGDGTPITLQTTLFFTGVLYLRYSREDYNERLPKHQPSPTGNGTKMGTLPRPGTFPRPGTGTRRIGNHNDKYEANMQAQPSPNEFIRFGQVKLNEKTLDFDELGIIDVEMTQVDNETIKDEVSPTFKSLSSSKTQTNRRAGDMEPQTRFPARGFGQSQPQMKAPPVKPRPPNMSPIVSSSAALMEEEDHSDLSPKPKPRFNHPPNLNDPRASTSARAAQNKSATGVSRVQSSKPLLAPKPKPKPKPEPKQFFWTCPMCTFSQNPATRPGCQLCSSPRPEDYQIPKEALLEENLPPEERRRIELERASELAAAAAEREEVLAQTLRRDHSRIEQEQLMLQAVLTNEQPFECPICMSEVAPEAGVRLHSCLHEFCRDCLKSSIENAEGVQIQCPYGQEDYACNQIIEDREIREVCGRAFYDKFLVRGVRTAEAAAGQSAYHCKTKDCEGWCLLGEGGNIPDNINMFLCPVCKKQNCLLCRAVHEGISCKQYQEDIKRLANNDEAARLNQQALDDMLKKGEAMNCPQCQVVIAKREGCDWIQCAMCKTEICWATKGRRWGPKGHGDTTAGCRCRAVNGQPCTPTCGNCH